ncbi:MAG: enolase C-terminal domain-like protein [Thermoguttaceae bacterium]
MKPTDMRIVDAKCTTEKFEYRAPMKFGGRVVRDVVLFNVNVTIETRSGRRASGSGSMTMGNVWAWPSSKTPVEETLAAMLKFGELVVSEANSPRDFAHPLVWAEDMSHQYAAIASKVCCGSLCEPMPKLAQLVAASPLEAAVFDAYGRALGGNVFNFLSEEYCHCDLSHFLGDEFRGEFLDRYTLRSPKPRMPLYHLVGALDPLTSGDVATPLHDGLPESLADWIPYNGLTHLKIKLDGNDLAWDVDRVVAVDRVASDSSAGHVAWNYSADFNERCENVEYVLAFLRQAKEASPRAFERLQYIEQPTHRDLKAFPDNAMHRAAAIKPVVIDESLVDFESLKLSRAMGYSGVALKACKGIAESLLMGAAAQKYGMFLCVQDLTCVGASFLLSASLASRVPTVAAIEGNGRQYCPAANAPWDQRYPTMFKITDGNVGTGVLDGDGVGFR